MTTEHENQPFGLRTFHVTVSRQEGNTTRRWSVYRSGTDIGQYLRKYCLLAQGPKQERDLALGEALEIRSRTNPLLSARVERVAFEPRRRPAKNGTPQREATLLAQTVTAALTAHQLETVAQLVELSDQVLARTPPFTPKFLAKFRAQYGYGTRQQVQVSVPGEQYQRLLDFLATIGGEVK